MGSRAQWLVGILWLSACLPCPRSCKSGDLGCALESMTWSDFGADGGNGIQGPLQRLVDVDVRTLEAQALAAPDGGLLLTPVASIATFSEGGAAGALVGLEWTDPSGCRPAFCMSACPKGAQCVGARCSPSIHDGVGRATTLHWVTYGAAPDGSDFNLRLIAVSAPGCPADVSAAIDGGLPGLEFSAPILIEMQITGQGVAATGGTSGGLGGSIVGVWKATTRTTQGATTTIQATTYTFNGDGSEEYDNSATSTSTDGTPSSSGSCVASGSYTTSGSSITIVTPSPPASCGSITSPYTTTWNVSGNTLTFGGDPATYVHQ